MSCIILRSTTALDTAFSQPAFNGRTSGSTDVQQYRENLGVDLNTYIFARTTPTAHPQAHTCTICQQAAVQIIERVLLSATFSHQVVRKVVPWSVKQHDHLKVHAQPHVTKQQKPKHRNEKHRPASKKKRCICFPRLACVLSITISPHFLATAGIVTCKHHSEVTASGQDKKAHGKPLLGHSRWNAGPTRSGETCFVNGQQ